MRHDLQARPFVPDRLGSRFRTLVVVDDSAFWLERFCRLIDPLPLIELVGTALQGPEALHLADVLRPDLVLMDLKMPLVNGLQATVLLRRRLRHVLVILMSSDDSPPAQAAARAHGAHGFIWKPRVQSDLMTEIDRAFRLNATDDQRSTL